MSKRAKRLLRTSFPVSAADPENTLRLSSAVRRVFSAETAGTATPTQLKLYSLHNSKQYNHNGELLPTLLYTYTMDNPRTDASQEAYNNFKKQFAHEPELLRSFNLNDEIIIRDFTHWVIIENRFPYDRMTRTNHMLVAKRHYSNLHEGTDDEQKEYNDILRELAEEGFYDALIENFPKVKSVKGNAHVHLVQWHNTDSTQK